MPTAQYIAANLRRKTPTKYARHMMSRTNKANTQPKAEKRKSSKAINWSHIMHLFFICFRIFL